MTNWTIVLLAGATGSFIGLLIAIQGYREHRAKGGAKTNITGPIIWGVIFAISLAGLIISTLQH